MHLRLVMSVGRERAQGEASVGSTLGEEQFQILPGQCECLARPRRGFVDLQHASNLRIISVNTACLQIASGALACGETAPSVTINNTGVSNHAEQTYGQPYWFNLSYHLMTATSIIA